MNDIPLKQMIAKVITKDDPAQGDWCVIIEDVNVWVDASSLVMGVVLESHGAILEDTR